MTKHQKRLSAPKHYPIERKKGTYITTIEGSRSSENAIPVTLLLREVLEYADTKKEVKKILKEGKVLRNGDKIRNPRQGVGILDVIELPDAEEAYRVIKEGENLKFQPVNDPEKVLAKIIDKRQEGEEYIYRLHNGENYRTKDEFETGSSLLFKNGGAKEIPLEEGAKVLVAGGQHAGEIAELKGIRETGMKTTTGTVKSEFEFDTPLQKLVPIEEIQVGENQ
ncbi:MAG: hypothetical protein ABEI78_02185 [Candidatus Nanohaloarchaea archaeon]